MRNKGIIVLFILMVVGLKSWGQTEGQALIHFKQRLLMHKSNNDGPGGPDSSRMLHLMIAGNIYQTEKHLNYCYDEETNSYNFREELKYIQPILSLGDVTIANLKTAFAGDPKNMFSAPDEFALALKYSGINALMHANLHAANIDRAAFNRTRDLMNEMNMYYTGAFADNFQRKGNYPLIINKKGFTIAILNYGTLNDRPAISRNFYINEIDKSQIETDMHMARAYKPDFVIVYLDWGANKQESPSYSQRDMAKFCFEQGADLVVGTHPNAPMPIEMIPYQSNGITKEGIVAYSLGNLIASNDEVPNRNGFLVDMELTKNNYTGHVDISDWGVIPVYTHYDTSSVPGRMKMFTVPCSAVESGDILANIPYIEKRRVINGAYEVRKMTGSVADEIQYNVNEMVASNVMETIDLTNAAWNNKYSPKRKEEIKPGSPPLLPVASLGTNNPPSLAKIYDEYYKKTDPKNKDDVAQKGKENTYTKEKTQAEQVFNGPTPSNEISPINFNAKPAANSSSATNTSGGANTVANQITKARPVGTAATTTNAGGGDNTIGNATAASNTSPEKENNTTNTAANTEGSNHAAPVEKAAKPVTSDKDAPANNKTNVTTTVAPARKEEKDIAVSTKTSGDITAGTPEPVGDISSGKRVSSHTVLDTLYRIQFYALQREIPLDTIYYTHLKGYEVVQENGLYKYLLGKYYSYAECYKYWKSQILPRYKQSFIVKYISGRRVVD